MRWILMTLCAAALCLGCDDGDSDASTPDATTGAGGEGGQGGEGGAIDQCGDGCPPNSVCTDGMCVEVDPCDDIQCGDGERCVEGACEPIQPPGAGEYPEGPYGFAAGDVIANLEFPAAAPWTLDDARTQDGARLIMIATVAEWCGNCRNKMAPLRGVMDRLGPAFVGVIDIYQNSDFGPADAGDATAWARQYMLPTVVPDPDFILADYLPNGARREQYILIDAATMRIVHASASFRPDEVEMRAAAWLAN